MNTRSGRIARTVLFVVYKHVAVSGPPEDMTQEHSSALSLVPESGESFLM